MPHPSAEVSDIASALERAHDSASSVLNHAAVELGAGAVAMFLAEGRQIEITHFWSCFGEGTPNQPISNSNEAVEARSGPVEGGSALAQLLRESISPRSQSFLLFPWQVRRRVVSVVFGFEAPVPPYARVPEAVVERLNLVGWTAWSVKELTRLRLELQTVNDRLAGRKLVERAKGVLQFERGISEEQAYEYMRGLSRSRRITLAGLAEEVLKSRTARDPAPFSAQ